MDTIMTKWILSVFCCILVSPVRSQTYAEYEYDLRDSLVGLGTKYSNVIRPAVQTDVQIRFNLLAINGLDTRGQTMSTTGWLTVKWTDSRLAWTPASHGNVDQLFDTENVLWRPELVIDNAVDSVGVISDEDVLMRVKSTGEVSWEPPGIYTTSCDIDVTYYPFDRQRCTIEVTSWAFTINEVNLTHLASNIFTGDYGINGEWVLTATEVSSKTLTETEGIFAQLDFTLVLERRVTYYVLNVMLPIILTSFLSVVTFILPFESGEKVSYALTVLLSYAVLMLLVSDNIPPTSLHVSVLGLYLAVILFIGASSTVLAVVNLYLFHTDPSEPVSKRSRTFVSRILVPLTSWKKLPSEERPQSSKMKIVPLDDKESKTNGMEKTDGEQGAEDQQTGPAFYSWREIAFMSDVLCFRIYAIGTVLVTTVFMIALSAGGAAS